VSLPETTNQEEKTEGDLHYQNGHAGFRVDGEAVSIRLFVRPGKTYRIKEFF